MSGKPATIIRKSEARNFMEGPEHCREYVKTPKIWLGTSTVPPGQRGNIDPGHPNSEEVYLCVRGHGLIFDETRYYELNEGDALLIPEGLPHTIINTGEEPLVIAWAGAPGQ
jgi:oxalate decarboxylase/phosphoglucose isomerase-like protein (cupin superfamily)